MDVAPRETYKASHLHIYVGAQEIMVLMIEWLSITSEPVIYTI